MQSTAEMSVPSNKVWDFEFRISVLFRNYLPTADLPKGEKFGFKNSNFVTK
ncbi:MAG: hypothetical protein WAP23_01295 [Candidatus Spechtbacterales bacterium]